MAIGRFRGFTGVLAAVLMIAHLPDPVNQSGIRCLIFAPVFRGFSARNYRFPVQYAIMNLKSCLLPDRGRRPRERRRMDGETDTEAGGNDRPDHG